MNRVLTVSFALLIFFDYAFAQKRTTLLGDAWTGEVVATNDSTREITIKYGDKGRTEIFVGVLEEGYKLRLKDGSLHELKVSEITPGRRIRVFYKTKQQDIGGRKTEVHRIFRLDLLGKDEYTLLRVSLNLAESIPVILATTDKLPNTNPLKLYLAIEETQIKESLVEWIEKWNKEQGVKYGSIELVPDLAQSDFALAVHWGSDKTIVLIPLEVRESDRPHTLYPATAYLVTKGAEGIKVLWQDRVLITAEKSEGTKVRIGKEIEKRMQARLKH